MDPIENSTQFVTLLSGGDEAAWRRFMGSYGRLALLAARRLGLGRMEQDEVFQQTCVSVYRSIGSLRDPEKLPVWVHRIARRHAIRLIRGRSRGSTLEDGARALDGIADDRLSAAEVAERIELAARVRRALEGMDPRCRRLLSAIYLDPDAPSYARIAESERMPVGSIGPTRARCLTKLRKILGRVSEGAPDGSIS